MNADRQLRSVPRDARARPRARDVMTPHVITVRSETTVMTTEDTDP